MGAIAGLVAGLVLAAQPVAPAAVPPPPDPAAWWTPDVPRTPSEQDPLQRRRLGRGEQPAPIDNGVDPLLYRLWGLQPLQTQLVRRGELVLEAWSRPALSVRQVVIRITVRRDGRAFVQARAGLGCCAPEIARRVDIDAELPRERIPALLALRDAAFWGQPRSVAVDYGGGAVSAVCLDGVSWDVTLLIPGQARHLHRACDDAELGSIAPALSAAVGAALGHDARFDVLFPRGPGFEAERRAYEALLAGGGGLKPGDVNRPQPPIVPVAPEEPPETATPPIDPK
ncbi:MAG: hypothetical protein JWP92_2363 [Caulobacter sp.]|nr:hypothetical protein [Caulobacter sp.]